MHNKKRQAETTADSSTNVEVPTSSPNAAKPNVGGSDSRQVVYMYADAFTTCDCGNNIVLSQINFNEKTYYGWCKCGKEMKLLNGKFITK